MVNRDPYATSPAHLSAELKLPLLGHFEPESRFLERTGNLRDFALDTIRSSHIFHAMLEAVDDRSRPPVFWVTLCVMKTREPQV